MAVDNSTKIAGLEDILASGLRAFTFDGQTTTYADRRAIVAEIQRLKREDDTNGYSTKKAIRTINLGGF